MIDDKNTGCIKSGMKKFETGPFSVNTWIVPIDFGSVVVIDPGGVTPSLLQCLEDLNVTHLEIMLTHGHFDHIGGIPELVSKYPDYRLWIHQADSAYLGAAAKPVHIQTLAPLRGQRLLDAFEAALPEATDFFSEGAVINGFTVLHTPGHTQGSICLWNKSAGFVFSGDTLFYGSHGRTDLAGGNEMQLYASLQRLFTELPLDTQVYPGHGSNTSIGFEKKFQGC